MTMSVAYLLPIIIERLPSGGQPQLSYVPFQD